MNPIPSVMKPTYAYIPSQLMLRASTPERVIEIESAGLAATVLSMAAGAAGVGLVALALKRVGLLE